MAAGARRPRLRAARADGLRGGTRARRGGGEGATRGRAGGRRLLVKRAHRSPPRARHHPARRRRRRPEQRAAKDTPRRALRLHAQGPRHRQGRRALLTATMDGRARVCRHQAEPACWAVQTSGPGRGPLGMATDRSHSQPSEAPPAHPGGSRRPESRVERPCRFQIEPISRLVSVYATASTRSSSPASHGKERFRTGSPFRAKGKGCARATELVEAPSTLAECRRTLGPPS